MINTWPQLREHHLQSAAYRSRARFVALACGRQSGKTEIAFRRLVRWLPVRKPWARPRYFIAYPTLNQAKRVAWARVKDLIPKHWIAKINETDLHITTVFGSELYVLGLDKPMRSEGDSWDGGIIDESSDQKPGVFEKTFRPALAARGGWCWRIGTPKRHGIGAKDFKSFYDRCASGDDALYEAYTWPSSDVMSQEEIDDARRTTDEKDFNELYNASWETASGGVYHAFDELMSVHSGVQYDNQRLLIIGSDFNVDPMCWIVAHKVIFGEGYGDSQGLEGLIVVDEVFKRNTNTQATLEYLHQQYNVHREHKGGYAFIGDAAGKARKTSASASDYVQIINDARFKPKRVLYPRSNPAIADRISAVNTLLRNAAGERRLFIHPRCTRLIADLQTQPYKAGSNEPEKGGDLGHMADALGYVVYMLWPPLVNVKTEQRISTLV